MPEAAGLAYRAAGPDNGAPAVLLHGYPESSYMWRDLLPALGDAGRRALAPDFAGFGDSRPDPPGTWERHVEEVERFRTELGLERVLLVVHDWGGLIGLRWACEHQDAVEALVISSTGFFPDGKWHGLAEGMRTPGTGEELMDGMTRDGFAAVMREAAAGISDDAIDEYWKAFGDDERRRGQLELYRSGDFDKIAPYKGKLAELGVPALVLWGEGDNFAPVAGAHRFYKLLTDSEPVVLDAGHFVFEEAPEESTRAVVRFAERLTA